MWGKVGGGVEAAEGWQNNVCDEGRFCLWSLSLHPTQPLSSAPKGACHCALQHFCTCKRCLFCVLAGKRLEKRVLVEFAPSLSRTCTLPCRRVCCLKESPESRTTRGSLPGLPRCFITTTPEEIHFRSVL